MKFLGRFGHGILVGMIIPAVLVIGVLGYVLGNYQHSFDGNKDCAVVFGAAVWKGSTPSHALYDRTMAGVDLWEKSHVGCLIMSGGASTYGDHEVDVMIRLATEKGIPRAKIIPDYEGANTLATLRNLPPNRSFVFVSNDFHLARIRMLAWKLEIEDFALHASPYQQGRYRKEFYFFLRELGGVVVYGLLPL